MKIYIVTQGSHENYHIIAATLDKDLAEKLAKKHAMHDDPAWVAEYDSDEAEASLAHLFPYSIMFTSTGGIYQMGRVLYDDHFAPRVKVYPANSWYPERIEVRLYALDDETAVRLAAKERAEFLAKMGGL